MLWSVLRGETRYMLGEEDTEADDSRWSDEIMQASANRCLRRLSVELPLPATTTIDAVDEQEDYALPDDFVMLSAVFYPETLQRRWGVSDVGYSIFGATLRLRPPPDSAATEPLITLNYYRSRVALGVVDDEGEAPEDEELDISLDEANLIQEWIKADMMASVISPDALLSRWKERGNREDSPIIPAARQFYALFEQALTAKKASLRSPVLELKQPQTRRRRYGRPWGG